MSWSGVRAAAPVGVMAVATALVVLGCLIALPTAAVADQQQSKQVMTVSAADSVAAADYPYGPGGDDSHGKHGKDKKDKLPFRTGAILLLESPWLDAVCDTASDPSPYGPYGPGGGMVGRKGGCRGGKADTYPHGGGDDDDPAKSVVWCNATHPDGSPQPYPGGGGGKHGGMLASWFGAVTAAVADAAAAILGRTTTDSESAVQSDDADAVATSQWDMGGFVLMGTDFTTPDVVSGGRVYLKNQNSRKFCRLAGSGGGGSWSSGSSDGAVPRRGRGDDDEPLPYSTLVCDLMTSGDSAEFVVELAEEADDDAAVREYLAYGAASGAADWPSGGGDWPSGGGDWPSGGGDWPSGGDDGRPEGGGPSSGDDSWPGRGGKDRKQTSVLVRLRAPTNDMRYCAPDRRIRGSPILCDLAHPDTSARAATTFKLVDATQWGS